MKKTAVRAIVDASLTAFPNLEAVYCFGSAVRGTPRKDSDVDVALLLPVPEAKEAGGLAYSDLRYELEDRLQKRVDLVNLRLVSVVFRKEIVMYGRRVFAGDTAAAETFEMLTLSLYQKLNEERREILDSFGRTGRAYKV